MPGERVHEGDDSLSVLPTIRFIRDHDGSEQRATFFELFFDLVYVFGITQLSHHLLLQLSWQGAAQTAFLGLAVYWAWNYTTWMTNWFDPATTPVRLVLVCVMLASLLMAVAIPESFDDHGLLFAASYAGLQVVRNGFVVAVTPRGAFNRNFQQILAWSVLSAPLWVAGGMVDGSARWVPWMAALGLDLLAPLVRYWLPGYASTPMREWEIDPGHFAERFQLLVIIVLGESIVVTGSTAADSGLGTDVVLALGFAFLSSVALWWLYFGPMARTAVRRFSDADVPGKVGRDAYTYLHIPIVAGVLLSAVGDELVLAHPHEDLEMAGALVALGGPALYLSGLVVFGARMGRQLAWGRIGGALVLLAAVPLAAEVSGLVVVGASAAVLVGLVILDHLGIGAGTSRSGRSTPATSGSRLPPS
jgi:low temperature requirement protein LtrA